MSSQSTSKSGTGSGTKPKSGSSNALVPKSQSRAVARSGGPPQQGGGPRAIQPAKNYDAVSFARAMNPNLGPQVKKLFDPERIAALQAQKTGIYIGWRCPDFKHDCQRVSSESKCFCGHLLNAHAKYDGNSVRVPCKQTSCKCKAFAFIPSRPEEVGEFWFQRRRDFDPSTWRAKCRCKHSHEEHIPDSYRRCKSCGCGAFDSNFLCAACDKHWEQHETVFETAQMRTENGFPVGEGYLPFAEIPSLRNMALTGHDDEDMSYMAVMQPPDMSRMPLPSNQSASNSTVFPFGGSKKPGFRPVYD